MIPLKSPMESDKVHGKVETDMKQKRILAAVLLLALLIGVTGCGVSKNDVVGVWEREPLYMAYYGCQTQMILSFADDGSFSALLLDAESHNILNYAGGTWDLSGSTIVAKRTESLTASGDDMKFEYDNGSNVIVFEGYEFRRTE